MQINHLRRREFITHLGGAAVAFPLVARAQQPERVKKIGVFMFSDTTDVEAHKRLTAFQQRLQQLGWTDGRSIRIDYRWAAGELDRMRVYAAELVSLAPDAILATNGPTLEALRQETRTVPMVFVAIPDPIAGGYVASLAHPGGNITGFTHFEYAIGGKWLEMLKEIAPRVTKVAVIWNPKNVSVNGYWPVIEAAAPSFAVEPIATHVQNAAEIERAIDSLAHESNVGLIVSPDFTTTVHRELIIALAARYQFPAIYPFRYFVADGGLVSYGINLSEVYRQAASYIDRILRGEKPGDLPVQTPTKFELVVNLKTAKALGLDVPLFFQQRADEVIE